MQIETLVCAANQAQEMMKSRSERSGSGEGIGEEGERKKRERVVCLGG